MIVKTGTGARVASVSEVSSVPRGVGWTMMVSSRDASWVMDAGDLGDVEDVGDVGGVGDVRCVGCVGDVRGVGDVGDVRCVGCVGWVGETELVLANFGTRVARSGRLILRAGGRANMTS